MYKLINAQDRNKGIGKDNQLPWYEPEDLKYLKKTTENSALVMGRRTFESLPGVLSNRQHIILTKDKSYKNDNELVTVIHNYEDIPAVSIFDDIFIFGGAEIYKLFLQKDLIDEIYITQINKDFECDAFFPEYDESKFELVSELQNEDLVFLIYKRKEEDYEN